MAKYIKRRFINIVRLGEIPGLTSKNMDYLRKKKKKAFFKNIISKKTRRKKRPSLNFSVLFASRFFKYKPIFNIAKYSSNYVLNDLSFNSMVKYTRLLNYNKLINNSKFYRTKFKKYFINDHKTKLYDPFESKKIKLFMLYYFYKNSLKFRNLLNDNATYLIFYNFTRYLYQFRERQRVKKHYSLKDYQLEKITKNLLEKKNYDITKLQKSLNTRLDSILFNNTKITSIRFAKQLIIHKKVKVNDIIISKPSYKCKQGDKISYEIYGLLREPFIFFYEKTKYNKHLKFLNYTALFEYYLKKL